MGCEGGPGFRSPEILENLAEKRPELLLDEVLGLCQLRELTDNKTQSEVGTRITKSLENATVGLADDDMLVLNCLKNGCQARCLLLIEHTNEDEGRMMFGRRRGGGDSLSDCILR